MSEEKIDVRGCIVDDLEWEELPVYAPYYWERIDLEQAPPKEDETMPVLVMDLDGKVQPIPDTHAVETCHIEPVPWKATEEAYVLDVFDNERDIYPELRDVPRVALWKTLVRVEKDDTSVYRMHMAAIDETGRWYDPPTLTQKGTIEPSGCLVFRTQNWGWYLPIIDAVRGHHMACQGHPVDVEFKIHAGIAHLECAFEQPGGGALFDTVIVSGNFFTAD